jgi:hypothetical protein
MQVTVALEDYHIECESSSFINNKAEFLVDTGSRVNVVRLAELKENVKLILGNQIYLKGINNKLTKTLGIVEIPLVVNNTKIGSTMFYIVENEVATIKSGILGQTFLKL